MSIFIVQYLIEKNGCILTVFVMVYDVVGSKYQLMVFFNLLVTTEGRRPHEGEGYL